MATLYRRGAAYYLQWSQDGRQHRRSLGAITAAQAERLRKTKALELATGTRLLHGDHHRAATLVEFAPHYLAWHAAEYPASHWRVDSILTHQLLPAFGHLALDQIRAPVVEPWKAARLQQCKPATVTKELRALRAVLARAVAWEWIDRSPLTSVRDPRDLTSRPPRWYSVGELQAIYAADATHRAIWQLLANTGLRRGEAQHLREEHILPDPGGCSCCWRSGRRIRARPDTPPPGASHPAHRRGAGAREVAGDGVGASVWLVPA